MNKSFVMVLVILLIVVAGGITYALVRNPDVSEDSTPTPNVTGNNTGGNVSTGQKATAPVVTTGSSVSPSATTALVTGSVNPKGAFVTYWYEYGKTLSLGDKTANQTMGSGFVGIQAPAYIVNLSKDTTYYFKLVAENQYGKVAGNQYTFQTTEGVPAPVGAAPTAKTLPAKNISKTTANIGGEVTPNKNETEYWFEYGQTPELGNTSAFSSLSSSAAKTSVSISLSDLDPLTTYYFRLNAQNKFGTINGSILNFKTSGPAKTN